MRLNPDGRWFEPVSQLVRVAALGLAAALIWHIWNANGPRDWPQSPIWADREPSVEELHVRALSEVTRERLEGTLETVSVRAQRLAALPECREAVAAAESTLADRVASQAIIGESHIDLITIHGARGELRGFSRTDHRGVPEKPKGPEAVTSGVPVDLWQSQRWLETARGAAPCFEVVLKSPIRPDSRVGRGAALVQLVPIREESSGRPIGAVGVWVRVDELADLLPKPDRNVNFAFVNAQGQLLNNAPSQGSINFPFTASVLGNMVQQLGQRNTNRGAMDWARFTVGMERVSPRLLGGPGVYVISYAKTDWLLMRDRQVWTIAILGALALALLGIIGLSFDWSRRQRGIAAELRQAKDQAEVAAAAKGQFLCHVSHEVRTPIAAVLGHLDVLEHLVKASQVADRALPSLAKARRNARQMLGVCDELIELAGAGQLEAWPVLEATCPLELVQECVRSLEPTALLKGLTISVQEGSQPVGMVRTDPARLMLVLQSLIGNAVKFTTVGSVHVELNRTDDHGIEISIRDTGPGFSPEALRNLCQPFWQADGSMNRAHEGLGLGLARSKRHLEILGGLLSVDSRLGEGTTVAVRLRAEPVPANALPVTLPGPSADRPATGGQFDGLRILVVDDHDDNQELMRFYLESVGATVEVASGGQAALDLLARPNHRPDMVFMDMQMPGVDGYTATRQLRQRGDHIPVVALTAHAMVEDKERCLAAGCNEYMAKPATHAAIIAGVRRMCPQCA